MATEYTQWYHLDKYVGADNPNLLDQYNSSVEKIDSAMKQMQNQINNTVRVETINEINERIDNTNDRIDSLTEDTENTFKKISGYYNIINYGADPTGTEYSDNAFYDCAIAASGKGYIYIPSGIYKVSSSIDLHTYDHFGLIGDGAIITTDVIIDYLIYPTMSALDSAHKEHFHDVKGITFNANNNARTCVICGGHGHISNCNFVGFTEYGIRPLRIDLSDQGGAGLRVSNCTIYNDPAVNNNTIGILAKTDCLFENLRIWGTKVGIKFNGGNNVLDSIYFWARYATFETIGVESATHTLDMKYNNVYFDSINTPIHNASGEFLGCTFLYSGTSTANNNNDFMVIKDDSTSLNFPLAWFTGCSFQMINTFDVSKFVPFSNPYRAISMTNCHVDTSVPHFNQLGYVDSYVKYPNRTNLNSTTGVWYKVATLGKNPGSTREYGIKATIESMESGRSLNFNYSSNEPYLYVFNDDPTYNLNLLAYVGIKKYDDHTDIFVKPKSGSIGYLCFSKVQPTFSAGAFYINSEETAFTDSDMTLISN